MSRPSRRSANRRGKLLALAGGAVLAAVVAAAFVYFVLFPTSSEKQFSLSSTAASVTSATGASGAWKIASGSKAGYRVREKLGFLPAANDAVGRTTAITGSAELAQADRSVTISSASFVIDVSKLTSDEGMRDQRIRNLGIESDTYPTASFKLATPIKLSRSALSGGVVSTSATGVLTMHGTSRTVTIPLKLRLSGSSMEAVGSLTFPWSRFDMTAPSVAGFVSVTGKATMEFDLKLRHA